MLTPLLSHGESPFLHIFQLALITLIRIVNRNHFYDFTLVTCSQNLPREWLVSIVNLASLLSSKSHGIHPPGE